MWCLKPFSITKIFEGIRSRRHIYADSKIQLSIHADVNRSCRNIIGGDNCGYWLFNTAYWYYELSVLQDLYSYCKSIHGMSLFHLMRQPCNNPIFDAVLYNWFLFRNKDKYGYSLIVLNEVLSGYLGEKYQEAQKKLDIFGAAFEYMCVAVDDSNKHEFIRFLNDYGVEIYSLPFGDEHINLECIDKSQVKMRTYYRPGL